MTETNTIAYRTHSEAAKKIKCIFATDKRSSLLHEHANCAEEIFKTSAHLFEKILEKLCHQTAFMFLASKHC